MIRSQLNSYSGSDPIWGFVALVGTERFSGEAAVGLDPRVRLFAVDGRVYFAEREGDAPIGALLVDSGVLSAAQLEQGSVRVGDTSSLARLFQRDPSIDRDAVELTIESATETLLASIANKAVGMPEVFPLRHHSSGVHHWSRGATITAVPPTVADEPVVEEVIETVIEEEAVVAEELPTFELPTFEDPVIEEPVVDTAVVDEMPTVELPVTDELTIDEPVTEAPVAQSPWHSLVPLVVEAGAQVNGFAHESHLEPESFEPESVEPESFEPESFEPESFEPESFEPESFEPESVEAVEEHVEPASPGLLSSLLWLTPAAAADAATTDAPEIAPEIEPADTHGEEPQTAEPELAVPAPTIGLLTLPSFSSMREPDRTDPPVEGAGEEPAEEETVAVAPQDVPTMPTLGSFTTLTAPTPEEELPPPTPVLTTDFFGALSDPTVESPHDQVLPGLPPLNAFEPGPLPAELPKLASAPVSMDELVAQNAQTSAEAQSWNGATHNLAAVDIWEMVDEIVDDGHPTEDQLVGTGGAEKRSRGWLRGRKS